MCDAVAIGIFSGIMSIGQAFAENAAQNRAIEAANMSDQFQYEFNVLGAQNQRNYEQNQQTLRFEQMYQNEQLARLAEANKMNDANQQIRQIQEKAAQEKREATLASMEQKGEILATGRAGANVANLLADVNRELGKYDYYTDTNLAFATAGVQSEKRGFISERASRIASISPYLKKTILDPMKPVPRPKVSVSPFSIGAGIMSGISAGVGYANMTSGTIAPVTAPGGQMYGPLRSDVRLKENIVNIGTSPQGYKVYEFNYKNDSTRYRGLMAQDVIQKNPAAVGIADGYLTVDYRMTDVNFEVA